MDGASPPVPPPKAAQEQRVGVAIASQAPRKLPAPPGGRSDARRFKKRQSLPPGALQGIGRGGRGGGGRPLPAPRGRGRGRGLVRGHMRRGSAQVPSATGRPLPAVSSVAVPSSKSLGDVVIEQEARPQPPAPTDAAPIPTPLDSSGTDLVSMDHVALPPPISSLPPVSPRPLSPPVVTQVPASAVPPAPIAATPAPLVAPSTTAPSVPDAEDDAVPSRSLTPSAVPKRVPTPVVVPGASKPISKPPSRPLPAPGLPSVSTSSREARKPIAKSNPTKPLPPPDGGPHKAVTGLSQSGPSRAGPRSTSARPMRPPTMPSKTTAFNASTGAMISPRQADPASLPPPTFSPPKKVGSSKRPVGHRRSKSTGGHNAISSLSSSIGGSSSKPIGSVVNRPSAKMLMEQMTLIQQRREAAGTEEETETKKKGDKGGFISRHKTKISSTTKKLKAGVAGSAGSMNPPVASVRNRSRTSVARPTMAETSARQEYTQTVMTHMLQLLGVPESVAPDILGKVLTHADDVLLGKEFSVSEMKILELVEKQTHEALISQTNNDRIVKIQSVARGWLVRKKLAGIVGEERHRLTTFNRLCTNVVDMEKSYLNSLNMLVSKFLQPLRARMAQGKDILRLEEISLIFSNVEVIREAHQKNKRRLTSVLEQWPFIEGMGRVLLEMGTDLAAYGVFVGNFKTAQDTILRLKAEKGSKFNTWLNEVQQSNPQMPELLQLIALPVNHIAKLEPLLEMLCRYCVAGSTQEKDFNNAYSMLHEARLFVQQSLQQSESTAEIMKVQRRITGYHKPLNLIKPDRVVVMEGAIVSPKRHLFLFNDLLLITKPSGKSKFSFKEMQILELVSCEDTGEKNTFVLKTPKEVHRLQTKSAEEKDKWVAAFNAFKRKNRTIGVDIDTIVKREGTEPDGVPSIVTQTVEAILPHLEVEGIFRISANQNEILSLQEIFDNSAPENRDVSRYSAHALCGVLKLWFRSLPEPLLTYKLYDYLVDAEREDFDGREGEQVVMYAEALKALPPSSFSTLVYLMEFLEKVSARSEVNKMTVTNLSIVFGPTLLRPETETLETTLNSPLANGIVQRIITHWRAILQQ